MSRQQTYLAIPLCCLCITYTTVPGESPLESMINSSHAVRDSLRLPLFQLCMKSRKLQYTRACMQFLQELELVNITIMQVNIESASKVLMSPFHICAGHQALAIALGSIQYSILYFLCSTTLSFPYYYFSVSLSWQRLYSGDTLIINYLSCTRALKRNSHQKTTLHVVY